MEYMTIGIVGQGFVGKAIFESLNQTHDVLRFDKFKPSDSDATLEEIAKKCSHIFVCVPTPMNDDGSADTTIVEGVVEAISSSIKSGQKKIVIIKSTIPPGTTDGLNEKFQNVDCIFNPEFLNAATATEDFKNQTYIVLGGSTNACNSVKDVYIQSFEDTTFEITDATTAECIKYVKNSFFAMKVSFANEMYQIMQKLGVNYAEMVRIMQLDDRVGWEHWKVPGPSRTPDGEIAFGFGGMCLPKDLSAFRKLARQCCQVDTKMLDAAWEKNLEVRPQRDWEKVPGVKVTKNG